MKRDDPGGTSVLGIGIDLVDVRTIERLVENQSFLTRTFSQEEQLQASFVPDFFEYLAGRFAVKEATFKALSPLMGEKLPDLRELSCIDGKDGVPSVCTNGKMAYLMAEFGVSELLVSISHEAGFATAIVLVNGLPLRQK